MEVVLEIVGHPGAAVAVVHRKVGQVGVPLQVGEGGAPVLIRLLVTLQSQSLEDLASVFFALGGTVQSFFIKLTEISTRKTDE